MLSGVLDLNNPRWLPAEEAERELALVEQRQQDACVDHIDPKLGCMCGSHSS